MDSIVRRWARPLPETRSDRLRYTGFQCFRLICKSSGGTDYVPTVWSLSCGTTFRAYEKREFVRRPTMDFKPTVGIVGFGGNGRRIAEVLAPWGNRILATDKYPWDKPDYVERPVGADQLDDILHEIDCLIFMCPA